MFALDKIVNHSTLDRSRPVKRIQGGKILDRVRLITAQNVSHARRFKLEYAGGQSLMEDFLVGLLIFERDVIQGEIRSPLRNQFQRVVENGERRQPEKIHFQQAHLFDGNHVKGGDNFIVLGFVQRHQVDQR